MPTRWVRPRLNTCCEVNTWLLLKRYLKCQISRQSLKSYCMCLSCSEIHLTPISLLIHDYSYRKILYRMKKLIFMIIQGNEITNRSHVEFLAMESTS